MKYSCSSSRNFGYNQNSQAASVAGSFSTLLHVSLGFKYHNQGNMLRYVGFVFRFLLFCLSFAFTYANLYNLNGKKTDACFQSSQKATAECLQLLIESYYGPSFTKYCPDFSQLLAESRCTGCPWDRLDPMKMNADIASEYRAASNKSELFHEPHANCSISKYVSGLGTFRGVADYVIRWAFVGSIPIFFSTGSIVQYTSGDAGLTLPSILGWEVHEWMFMGAVWVSYNIGIIMLSISEEYYRYCDTAASNLAFVIARDLSYFVLIYYSFCRCCRLDFPRFENSQGPQPEMNMVTPPSIDLLKASNEAQQTCPLSQSWYTFLSDKDGMSWNEYIGSKKAVALFLVYGSSFAVLFICITDTFRQIDFRSRGGPSICFLPSIDTWTRAIAISKLTLEPLAHIVYSLGASTTNKVAYRIRYAVLALIAGVCVTIFFLMGSKSLYSPNGEGFLVLGVPLWSTVWKFTEITHAFTVSMYGLLEPLRNGSI